MQRGFSGLERADNFWLLAVDVGDVVLQKHGAPPAEAGITLLP
jgi:hypothetical protein